jgi:hypothetical protein
MGAPEISFSQQAHETSRNWVSRQFHSSEIRMNAPNPTGAALDFDMLYLVGESLTGPTVFPNTATPECDAFFSLVNNRTSTSAMFPVMATAPADHFPT